MNNRHLLLPAIVAAVAVVFAGCSSDDSESVSAPEATSTVAEQATSASSTSVPLADNCLLQIEDMETLKPPVPNKFKTLKAEEGNNLLSCTYRDNDVYITINEVEYQGSYKYGDGSKTGDGYTCADGSQLKDEVTLTDLENTRKQLDSAMICWTEPTTNKYGLKNEDVRQTQVKSQAFRDIGEGLYCIIPSNCFLLTQYNMYAIALPRSVNGSTRSAMTFENFGGYEGSKAVANLIVSAVGPE